MFSCSVVRSVILLSGLLLTVGTAFAEQTSPDLSVTLGFGLKRMSYREYDMNGSEVDREVGWLKSGLAGIEGSLADGWRWFTDFERSYDSVQYIGQSQSGTPSRTSTDENFRTYRLGLTWQPYTGWPGVMTALGKTNWQRMIRANDVTGALDEYYRWDFLSLGLQYDYFMAGRLLHVAAGYTRLINGVLEVDFSDYGYGKADIDLATGHELWLEVGYQLIRFSHSAVGVSYQYTYEKADASDYARAGALLVYEPESHSRTHRYLLVWEFSF